MWVMKYFKQRFYKKNLNDISTKNWPKWGKDAGGKMPMGPLSDNRPYVPHGHFAPLRPYHICIWVFCPTPPGRLIPLSWAFRHTPIGVGQKAQFSFICYHLDSIYLESEMIFPCNLKGFQNIFRLRSFRF